MVSTPQRARHKIIVLDYDLGEFLQELPYWWIALADQRILGWDEHERAAGIPIRPLFEQFSGFVHLFSEVD